MESTIEATMDVPLWSLQSAAALLTLTALEVVLGIDNIVFLSILTARVEASRQELTRRVGLILAMGMRIGLLLSLAWVLRLTAPLFSVAGLEVTGRDLILLGGGLFLIAKGTFEIHHLVEKDHPALEARRAGSAPIASILAQIAVMDTIFSLDSVITAVGMAQRVEVMVAAVIAAILVMLAFAGPIARFVERHLPIKTLALSFLVLVGVLLVADGLHHHLPRGSVYFAMLFSLVVELLNLRMSARRHRIAGGPTP
ncbi:MAG: TerC family protein [Planctomycetota bacterium]